MKKSRAGLVAALPLLAGVVLSAPARADDSGPQFSNVSIAGYASTSLPISFTVTDAAGTISSVAVEVNGMTVETLQTTDMTPISGGFSGSTSIPTSTYADGQTLAVSLSATDDDNNPSGIAGQNVVIDHTRPAVTFIGDLAYQANPTAVIDFTATDAHLLSVTCRLDQLAPAPCASTVSYTGLTAGLHIVRVTAVDLAGNTTTTPFQITNGAPRIMAITGGFTATLLRNSTGQLIASITGDAVPALMPTGSLTVTAGGRTLGTATLVASATADVATATLPVTTLDPTRVPMTLAYSGDAIYPPMTGSAAFFVHPYGALKLGSSLRHNRSVTVAISCPATAVGCKGSAVLGGKTLKLAPAPGKTTHLSFPLPASALAALLRQGTATVRLDLNSDLGSVRHLIITLHAAKAVGKAQRRVT